MDDSFVQKARTLLAVKAGQAGPEGSSSAPGGRAELKHAESKSNLFPTGRLKCL